MEQFLIERTQWRGADAIVTSNADLLLVAIPGRGGKLASLIRQQSGYEYLLQPAAAHKYRELVYADDFANGDLSGFDECIPTVAKCRYPSEPAFGKQVPDHGDVWSLPSKLEVVGEKVSFITSLISLPLRFTKTVQLQGNTVRLDYEVANFSHFPLRYLWSAHPLLSVQPETEIVLPEDVDELEIGWSKDGRLGQPGDRCSWPIAKERSRRSIDISKVVSLDEGTAEKLFTPRLSQGSCGLFVRKANESIAFRFDPTLVPYLGLWICLGGWPLDRTTKQLTVALEPCSGRPDSLEEAIKRDECSLIEGHASRRWWLEMEVSAGRPCGRK